MQQKTQIAQRLRSAGCFFPENDGASKGETAKISNLAQSPQREVDGEGRDQQVRHLA